MPCRVVPEVAQAHVRRLPDGVRGREGAAAVFFGPRGGDAKGADISSLAPYLTQYVSHVFALGKDAHLFAQSFAHTTQVATMKEAVKGALRLAAPGGQRGPNTCANRK